MRPTANNQGFTIVELLIATLIFSVILLAALAGFLQVGRLFYKGVNSTQTSETSKQVLNDVKANIRLATVNAINPNKTGNGGYTYHCVNGNRYTYMLDKQVNLATPNYRSPITGNYGILKEYMGSDTACGVPCYSYSGPPGASYDNCTDPGSVPFNNPVELLSNNMRVAQFDIFQTDTTTTSNSDLWTLKLKVAYGDDGVFEYPGGPGLPSTIRCQAASTVQQFCAVVDNSTSVYRGNQP
jgi:prepilin-type N-terminal cleavage/methylation domain-containing protein